MRASRTARIRNAAADGAAAGLAEAPAKGIAAPAATPGVAA